MNKRNMSLAMAVGFSVLMTGCASTPQENAKVNEARTAYDNIRNDPNVARSGDRQLRSAREELSRAEALLDEGADVARIEHVAYLATRHAQIAAEQGERAELQQQINSAEERRKELELQMRSSEAAEARREAEELRRQMKEMQAEQTDRGMVLTLGDVLFDLNRAELKSAGEETVARLGSDGPATTISEDVEAERAVTRSAGEACLALLRSGRLWLIFASTACLGPAFDLGALLPLYLAQMHKLSPAAAAVMSGAYPLGAALSLVVSGWVYDRMKPKERAAYFGSLLVVALGSLTMLARHGAGTSTPKWLLASCLFSTMFGVAPSLYLPNSALILRLAGRYSGTVMGINDLPGTALAAVWLGFYPTLLKRGGWAAVLLPIQVLLACSAVCTVSYLTVDARSPTERIV